MRYQAWPTSALPLHVVIQVPPVTRATAKTFVFFGSVAFRVAEVVGLVRSATPSQVVYFGYCVVFLKSPVAA